MDFLVIKSPDQPPISSPTAVRPETLTTEFAGITISSPFPVASAGAFTPIGQTSGTYNGVLDTNQHLVFPLGGTYPGSYEDVNAHFDAVIAGVPLSAPTGYSISFTQGTANIQNGGFCCCFTVPSFAYQDTEDGATLPGIPNACDGEVCPSGGIGAVASGVYTNSPPTRPLLSFNAPPTYSAIYFNDGTREVRQRLLGIDFPPFPYDEQSPGITGAELRELVGFQSLERGEGEYLICAVEFFNILLYDEDTIPKGISTRSFLGGSVNLGYDLALFRPLVEGPPSIVVETGDGGGSETLAPIEEPVEELDEDDEDLLRRRRGQVGGPDTGFFGYFTPFNLLSLPTLAVRLRRTNVVRVMNTAGPLIQSLLSQTIDKNPVEYVSLVLDLNGHSLINLKADEQSPDEIRRKQ